MYILVNPEVEMFNLDMVIMKKDIQSATFDGKCVEVIDEIKNGSRLGLFDCDSHFKKLQKFEYEISAKEFRPYQTMIFV